MQHDELTEALPELLEPLDEWVHVQPSVEEERRGRIYLPAEVGMKQLQRSMVLAFGDQVHDLQKGDVVFVLPKQTIELRDGSQLVRREHVVARVQA